MGDLTVSSLTFHIRSDNIVLLVYFPVGNAKFMLLTLTLTVKPFYVVDDTWHT